MQCEEAKLRKRISMTSDSQLAANPIAYFDHPRSGIRSRAENATLQVFLCIHASVILQPECKCLSAKGSSTSDRWLSASLLHHAEHWPDKPDVSRPSNTPRMASAVRAAASPSGIKSTGQESVASTRNLVQHTSDDDREKPIAAYR